MEDNVRLPFWQKTWFIVLLLFLFPPAGIVLMWVSHKFNNPIRIVLTILGILWTIIAFLMGAPSQVVDNGATFDTPEYELSDPEIVEAIAIAKKSVSEYTNMVTYPTSDDDWTIVETKDGHWLITTKVKTPVNSDPDILTVVTTKDVPHYIELGDDVLLDDGTVE